MTRAVYYLLVYIDHIINAARRRFNAGDLWPFHSRQLQAEAMQHWPTDCPKNTDTQYLTWICRVTNSCSICLLFGKVFLSKSIFRSSSANSILKNRSSSSRADSSTSPLRSIWSATKRRHRQMPICVHTDGMNFTISRLEKLDSYRAFAPPFHAAH